MDSKPKFQLETIENQLGPNQFYLMEFSQEYRSDRFILWNLFLNNLRKKYKLVFNSKETNLENFPLTFEKSQKGLEEISHALLNQIPLNDDISLVYNSSIYFFEKKQISVNGKSSILPLSLGSLNPLISLSLNPSSLRIRRWLSVYSGASKTDVKTVKKYLEMERSGGVLLEKLFV